MFEEIIGQTLPKKILSTQLKDNKINHAYIFYGKDGVGKMTMAKKFSQYIVCENKNACGNCPKCKQFLLGTVDDFKIIDILDDKTEILVEQIREVVNDVYIKPYIYNKKIYIVNNADKMNIKAQNAFLKVLEEPPQYAVFILIATNISKILPTIKSRGVEVRFSDLKPQELKQIIKNSYNMDLPDTIATVSDGSVSLAYSELTNSDASIVRENIIKSFISLLKTHSEKDMIELYKILSDDKENTGMNIKILYSLLTDIINSKESDLIKLVKSDINISHNKIYSLFEILQELSMRINTNANTSLLILDALSRIRKALIWYLRWKE